jgi:hypothetical protein
MIHKWLLFICAKPMKYLLNILNSPNCGVFHPIIDDPHATLDVFSFDFSLHMLLFIDK